MRFKHPIQIDKVDRKTGDSSPFISKLYANINKNTKGNEYLNAGAVQSKHALVFEVRYRPSFEEVLNELQLFRIVYQGREYSIQDYDNYQEQNVTVKLLGVHV